MLRTSQNFGFSRGSDLQKVAGCETSGQISKRIPRREREKNLRMYFLTLFQS
jgi:hypothetical protein